MTDDMHVIDPDLIEDDIVQTFQLESSSLRGRIVRLGDVLEDILTPHDYPKPVKHLVAENVALSVLLASMLKYEGIFTLQAQGDGPIGMLVADCTSDHKVRGCASFDKKRIQRARKQLSALKTPEGSQHHLAQFLGKGHIAFTVDQGAQTDRYQGIVELKGSSLVDCVQHYFAQSEQIGTGIKMAVGQRDGKWRAAGIMLQHMPGEGGNITASNIGEDDWRRAMIFLDSCTEDELLDPALNHNMLLMRLFHEEGVRIYDAQPVSKECRCSAQRVENILLTMQEEEREELAEDDGSITMHCEFCGTDYVFDLKAIARKIKDNEKNQ